MSIAENLSNIEEALAEAFVAVAEKGAPASTEKNLMNLINAINVIGLGNSVTPRAVESSTTVTDYIENNLEYHLTQAYNAIANKSGAVPAQKSFANLPAAVRSIPPANYGTMWYLNDAGQRTSYSLLIRQDLNNLGCSATFDEGTINRQVVFHDGLTIPRGRIVGYDWGPAATSMPDGFCSALPNFDHPIVVKAGVIYSLWAYQRLDTFNSSFTVEEGVISLYNMLSRCPLFNQPITLPDSVVSFGADFLSYDTAFNQSIHLPPNITTGLPAFRDMDNFVGPLYIPASYSGGISTNPLILTGDKSNVPAFRQGVTITGPGRDDFISQVVPTNLNGRLRDGVIQYRNVIGVTGWSPSVPDWWTP